MSIHTISPAALRSRLQAALIRFPLVFLTCVLLAIVASLVYWGEMSSVVSLSEPMKNGLTTLIMLMVLAVPLFAAAQLYREVRNLKLNGFFLICGAVIVVLALYSWYLPAPSAFILQDQVQYGAVVLLTWLLFLFSPLSHQPVLRAGFWSYTAMLIIIFAVAVVLSGIVWGGLSVAWTAIISLFDLRGSLHEWIFQFWIVGATLLAPALFLSALPNWQATEWQQRLSQPVAYPNIIKGLIDYILLPLAGLFTFILYIYLATILIRWEWPQEGVTRWIILTTVLILVVWKLVYPRIITSPLHKRLFNIFFGLYLPLAAVHMCAIGVRINAYGMTPARYAVALFGIWIAGVGIYELLRRQRGLFFPLISLSILVLVGTWSPLNVFTLSRISQVNRLEHILENRHLLAAGTLQPPNASVIQSFTRAECDDLSSILKYLTENHHPTALPSWLQPLMPEPQRIRSTIVGTACDYKPAKTQQKAYQQDRDFTSEPFAIVDQAYQYVIQISSLGALSDSFFIDAEKWEMESVHDGHVYFTTGLPGKRVDIDLRPIIESLLAQYETDREDIPAEQLLIPFESEWLQGKIWIQDIGIRITDPDAAPVTFRMNSLSGILFIQ